MNDFILNIKKLIETKPSDVNIVNDIYSLNNIILNNISMLNNKITELEGRIKFLEEKIKNP